MNAKGELYTTFESPRLLEAKLADDQAFFQFQEKGDCPTALHTLMPHLAPAVLNSCDVSRTLVGEWFSRITLGQNVRIKDDVNIMAHGGVMIDDNATIEKGAQIITVGHGMHPSQRFLSRCCPIVIEEGARIGKDALIVNTRQDGQPLVIGKAAVVLQGSIVTCDVAAGETVGGRPAKPVVSTQNGGPLIPRWQSAVSDPRQGCLTISNVAQAKELFPNVRAIVPIHMKECQNVTMEGDCFINRNSVVRADGEVKIASGLQVAVNVVIDVARGASLEIGERVWIGAGVHITAKEGQNLKIGAGSILAAGANVTQDVPEMSVVVGNNRITKKIDDSAIEPVPARWHDERYVAEKTQTARTWNREQRQKMGF